MERSSVERTEAKSVLRKVTNHGALEFSIVTIMLREFLELPIRISIK